MINSANKYTIADIFSVEQLIKYSIPKFQREYTWSKENWEELIGDIIESDGSHFIGSIICINMGTDTLNPSLELIDGQQRLTTISLLYCAIFQLLSALVTDEDEDLRLDLGNLKWRIVNKRDRVSPKIELSQQNNNFSDYKWILNEIGIIEFSDDAQNRGNRNIVKAFRFFLGKLEQFDKEGLTKLLEKLNSTLLVKIEVSSHSDAFMLFESLNNRGVPLSAIDLIKNKMLAEVDEHELMSIDDAFARWIKIIKNLEDYPTQERFLRQYYNAFKHLDAIKVDGVSKATKSSLIKIYESLINRDTLFIFNDLMTKSEVYKNLINPVEASQEQYKQLAGELIDLINVKAAPAYTFLMFVFSTFELNIDVSRDLVSLLVKYFIRRNITDFPNTRNLDQIFIDLIAELGEDNSLFSVDYVKNYLTDSTRFSSLEKFRYELNGDLYEANVDATRFVLSKIEETRRTNEIHVDFWERGRGNILIWSIEHVFPEGKNIPESWVQMIADGDKVLAEKIHEELVHKIGNLTLTGYNQSLSNFDFEKKRDRKDSRGNYIGYKNGLFLNEALKDKQSWTADDIKERTEKLVSIALEQFNIDGN